MAPQKAQASQGSRAGSPRSVAADEALLRLAERELSEALLAHQRPMAGMYTQPSRRGDIALDRAVHVLCAEAHRLDLRAEELLIALKHAWAHLATTRARQLGDRDGDVLRSVVTTCIEVYYIGSGRPVPKDMS